MTIEEGIKEFEKYLDKVTDSNKKAKGEKLLSMIEIAKSVAENLPKGLKRISRLKMAFKKRAYVKSKFYGRLEVEKIAILTMPYRAAFQFTLIRSKPTPKFERNEYIKLSKLTLTNHKICYAVLESLSDGLSDDRETIVYGIWDIIKYSSMKLTEVYLVLNKLIKIKAITSILHANEFVKQIGNNGMNVKHSATVMKKMIQNARYVYGMQNNLE